MSCPVKLHWTCRGFLSPGHWRSGHGGLSGMWRAPRQRSPLGRNRVRRWVAGAPFRHGPLWEELILT